MTTGAFRRPVDVAVVDGATWGGLSAPIYLGKLPDGPLLVLDGSAGVIWAEAMEAENLGELVDRVAEACGAAADDIGADVAELVESLAAAGFLEIADSVLESDD